MTSCS
ncbi:uncharacterized protein FFE2_16059 [Fusarium fujikuroi]